MAKIAVHKDFHTILSFSMDYFQNRLGLEGMEKFLRVNVQNIYKPLIAALKFGGLPVLEKHFRDIFLIEEGDFDLYWEKDDILVLEVHKCPAIHHMKEHGHKIAEKFCESTRITNEEICYPARVESSVEYDQDNGCCVQKFREVKDDLLH